MKKLSEVLAMPTDEDLYLNVDETNGLIKNDVDYYAVTVQTVVDGDCQGGDADGYDIYPYQKERWLSPEMIIKNFFDPKGYLYGYVDLTNAEAVLVQVVAVRENPVSHLTLHQKIYINDLTK